MLGFQRLPTNQSALNWTAVTCAIFRASKKPRTPLSLVFHDIDDRQTVEDGPEGALKKSTRGDSGVTTGGKEWFKCLERTAGDKGWNRISLLVFKTQVANR